MVDYNFLAVSNNGKTHLRMKTDDITLCGVDASDWFNRGPAAMETLIDAPFLCKKCKQGYLA